MNGKGAGRKTTMRKNDDLISRQAAIDATWFEPSYTDPLNVLTEVRDRLKALPSAQPEVLACGEGELIAQPDIEKICARIKAEAIKHNVEYMKHGDRYMLGFVDGMRLARRIVDGTIDDPVYFTFSGE